MFDHPFYFLRHGETVWNKSKITQGQTDSQLNDTGQEQAMRAGEILASEPIARIISSPLTRVRHTAEAVAAHHDIDIEFDEGLKECHLGEMQGKPHGEWLADYWTGEFSPPGGETFDEFAERVWNAMSAAVAKGPNTLIVAHGGLWIAANSYARIHPPMIRMPNAQPMHVTPSKGIWSHRILGQS